MSLNKAWDWITLETVVTPRLQRDVHPGTMLRLMLSLKTFHEDVISAFLKLAVSQFNL